MDNKINWNLIIQNANEETKNNKMLFRNGEPTAYLKYLMGNFSKNFFKDSIITLDKENNFYRKSAIVEVADPDYIKEENKKISSKIDPYLQEFKEKNPHMYRLQASLPNYKAVTNLSILDPSFDISLEQSIQGYKEASELLNLIDNSSLDEFCINTTKKLKLEHKQDFQDFKLKIIKDLKLPTNEEIERSAKKISVQKYRLSLDRSKNEGFNNFNSFLQLVSFQ